MDNILLHRHNSSHHTQPNSMIIIVDDNYNNTVCTCKLEIKWFVILISNKKIKINYYFFQLLLSGQQYILNVRSRGKQLVLFSQESWDLRENKTNWFPEGTYIKCFVIFLDFHFNVLQQQQKNTLKRSESKQYDSVLIRTQI